MSVIHLKQLYNTKKLLIVILIILCGIVTLNILSGILQTIDITYK